MYVALKIIHIIGPILEAHLLIPNTTLQGVDIFNEQVYIYRNKYGLCLELSYNMFDTT